MAWVRQTELPSHRCDPPSYHGYFRIPVGQVGDLWRCDTCHTLWRVANGDPGTTQPRWRLATLWQRIQYRRR